MLDVDWLNHLTEDELILLYDQCHAAEKDHRRAGRWDLYHWERKHSLQVCDALTRLYMAERNPAFSRAQLSFPGAPRRVSPEARVS